MHTAIVFNFIMVGVKPKGATFVWSNIKSHWYVIFQFKKEKKKEEEINPPKPQNSKRVKQTDKLLTNYVKTKQESNDTTQISQFTIKKNTQLQKRAI